MKKLIFLSAVLVFFASFACYSQSLKGLSLGGTTGLITTPTGRIGWEKSSDIGLDIGYHFSTDSGFGENENILNAAFSLFRKFETGFTLDFQPGENTSDVIFFGKYQVSNDGQSGMAIGGNYQLMNLDSDSTETYGQIYLASTYSGSFMEIPSTTTVVFGKTFNLDQGWDDRIDFSMGFDLSLFPDVFNNHVRWISEFANYSYSVDSVITNADSRGAFNTGIRVDVMGDSPYKFVIDATLMDVFDEGIDKFAIGGSFGISLK